MDNDEVTPFGTATTNYGWTKPTVGADVDVWGGYINTDLDGIDSTVKSVSNVANAALPLTGAVMTGLNDNRIINGDMWIDARNNGASGTATGYTVDRWQFNANLATKGTWGRTSSSGLAGFPWCLGFTSNSAYASAAGDFFTFLQNIEADMVSDFAWGTASAQPVTLSFWVLSNKTGTFGGSIQNYGGTRSYPFTYSVPAVAWTKIVITIPGDTAGTWVMSGNGASVGLNLDFGTGTTYRGPANIWAGTNYVGATGTASIVATNAANFYVTGVKLEIGSVATPYNRQSLAKSMADCQRYYNALRGLYVSGYNSVSGLGFFNSFVVPTMRAAPTITFANTTYTSASGISSFGISSSAFSAAATASASGTAANVLSDYLLNAEL